jgi:hypothetical protein
MIAQSTFLATKRSFQEAAGKATIFSQLVAPGKGAEAQPPAAPTTAAKPLALPPPAPTTTPRETALAANVAAQVTGAKPPELSLLQKQPEIAPKKVPSVVPGRGTEGPSAVSDKDKAAVVQSLVGMGLKKPQAQQLVANAQGNTVDEVLQNALKAHGQGAIRGVESASFKAPAQQQGPPPPAPTGKAQAQPTTAPARIAKSSQQSPPPAKKESELRAAEEPAEYAAPKGSTHGVANPPSFSALTPGKKLSEAVKEHASLLSEDDPRVRKQADGTIKGEHFIEGDPIHDQLLSGLPEGKGGPQHQMLSEAKAAIAEKRPMDISYLSAPKEAAKFPTRESRTVQYNEHSPEARLMGSTKGQLVGHSFIPTAVGVSLPRKAGEPHQSYIQGISTNILANNFQHLNEKLASLGIKTPYGKLGPKFYNDLQGYYSNLNAGHTAAGRGYAVGTEDLPNEPDTSHVPYKLSRKEADFIGTVINNTAAFAKHEDAQRLRELARVNGSLISEAGETNRLRHQIEQVDPGWRSRVLEPSIRSFKTGLIVAHHSDERHFPGAIRPGKEFQELTRAIQRTSERGRPDVPIAVSLHHGFADNAKINAIERKFSQHEIDEAEARKQLESIGEDPSEFRFIGGSGGLVSPYESDPESIDQAEHDLMKDNLRQQWINGKLDADKYRQKSAEIPLPTKAPKTAPTPKPVAAPEPTESEEPEEVAPEPKAITPAPKPKLPKPVTPEPERPESQAPAAPAPTPRPQPKAPVEPPVKPEEGPEPSERVETPAAKPKPRKAVQPAPAESPEEAAPEVKAPPPALGEPVPAAKGKKTLEQKSVQKEDIPFKDLSPQDKASYVAGRVKDRLSNQIQGAVKLRPALADDGSYQHDEAGNPKWEKDSYDLVNSPVLGRKRLKFAPPDLKKTGEDIYAPSEHTHLNDIDRKRLSWLEQKSAVDTMADRIVDSYQNQMQAVPEVLAARGWYSRMRDKLKAAFGNDAEIFAQLLGATSARTGVAQNFVQALDADDQLESGKFDRHIEKYLEAHDHLGQGEGALGKHMLDSGIVDELPKSDAAGLAAWIAHHDILPRQKNGQKFNANSNQVLKVLAQKWLQNVKAPKTPNFAGNLSGRTLESTIDVWSARFLHELGNEGNKRPWMLQPGGEGGVRGLDFAFGQRAFRKAADRLGMNPDDAQALSWYWQKHLWDQRGHTKGQGARKASFDETFDRIFSPTGERLSDEEARRAFADEKEEPEEEDEQEAA